MSEQACTAALCVFPNLSVSWGGKQIDIKCQNDEWTRLYR
jgi:hypothetical protein